MTQYVTQTQTLDYLMNLFSSCMSLNGLLVLLASQANDRHLWNTKIRMSPALMIFTAAAAI